MDRVPSLLKSNLDLARRTWGELSDSAVASLKELTQRYRLNIAIGDLQYLDRRWYVTHSGLLRIAHRRRCQGMRTTLQRTSSDPAAGRWVFKATVYKSAESRGFVGYGDADPSNVSPLVRGAEMRIAETRAVNRALRKAYGLGLCSVEELGCWRGCPIEQMRRRRRQPHAPDSRSGASYLAGTASSGCTSRSILASSSSSATSRSYFVWRFSQNSGVVLK